MTKITSFDLSPFMRHSIGVDRLFDRIVNQFDQTTANNYPPYNIIKISEETFEIQLAVAGFGQGDIDVSVQDGQLIITGDKKPQDNNVVYQHQGISARRFIRTFQLGDYVEVTTALAKDGILTVQLERVVPEAMKPKTIAITYAN